MGLDGIFLDGYELVRELGRGGRGVVYEAIELSVARRVAIKILPPAAALDQRQIAEFRHEALTMAGLDHPHILPVYAVGCQRGTYFYTMKCIEGQSLAESIAHRRHTDSTPNDLVYFQQIATWGVQAAGALEYAHAKHVVHGDIKPANLLVDKNGHLWLSDFGAARCATQPDKDRCRNNCRIVADAASIRSDAGSVGHDSVRSRELGSVRYLSPEQVSDVTRVIDCRSDIYSLGATLFELTTLKPAMNGNSTHEILNAIAIGSAPHVSTLNPAIPEPLAAIIMRAMSHAPQDRFATAGEMSARLEQVRQFPSAANLGCHSKAKRTSRVRRQSGVAAAGVLALALAHNVGAYLASAPSTTAHTQRVSATQQASTYLRALSAGRIDEVFDNLARGIPITPSERQLLDEGPDVTKELLELAEPATSVELHQEMAKLYFRLGMFHEGRFDFARQETLLQKSISHWQSLNVRLGKSTSNYLFAETYAELAIVELCSQTGRIDEAKVRLTGILQRLTDLEQTEPSSIRIRVGLAAIHARACGLFAYVLPPKELEAHQNAGLTLLESLPSQPDDWPRDALFPFENYGDFLAECRLNLSLEPMNLNNNEALLAQAVAYYTDSDGQESASVSSRDKLAHAKLHFGVELDRRGKRTEAESQLLAAIGLFQCLTAEFPEIVRFRFELAAASHHLAQCWLLGGKAHEAASYHQQAIAILTDLAEKFPGHADVQHYLAGSLNNSGPKAPDHEQLNIYLEASRREQLAIALNPEHRQYRRWLANQSKNIAAQYEKREDFENGERHYRLAIDSLQRTTLVPGAAYEDQHELGHLLLALGVHLTKADRYDAAESEFRAAVDSFNDLLDNAGRKPHDYCMRADAFQEWGSMLAKRGDRNRANQLFLESIQSEEEALKLEASNLSHRRSLAKYQTLLDELN